MHAMTIYLLAPRELSLELYSRVRRIVRRQLLQQSKVPHWEKLLVAPKFGKTVHKGFN